MNRRTALAFGAALVVSACADSNRETASRVRDAMVRADDRVSDVSNATMNGQSVTFTWDVETSLSWDAYADWQTQRLTSFRLVQRRADYLAFSRLTDGDAHRLEIAVVAGSPTTHAHIVFTLSPD